jgi:hypothetical protein
MSSTVPIGRAWLGPWHLAIGEKNSPLNLIFGYFEKKYDGHFFISSIIF